MCMSEQEAIKMLNDLLEGFTELNKHGVIHRGLKLSNIMVNEGVFKLAGNSIKNIQIVGYLNVQSHLEKNNNNFLNINIYHHKFYKVKNIQINVIYGHWVLYCIKYSLDILLGLVQNQMNININCGIHYFNFQKTKSKLVMK